MSKFYKILILLFVPSLCFGNGHLSLTNVPVYILKEAPEKYYKKRVSVVGVLDLSHFEGANIDGVIIDWACYDPNNPDSAKDAWDRWNAWMMLGIDKKQAKITGVFIKSFQSPGHGYEITKIESIEIISGEKKYMDNKYLKMNCKKSREY